ncbi:MAG TPA: orotidine-5'-phosphate decarboxylase [Candidatus Solibacter sp.]|nr:orotidine-5'-phosphate decarboxylase [Candidatus Solibacter sp.]
MPIAAAQDMRERLIVALDVPNAKAAQDLMGRIGDSAVFYKVGLQLFTAEGPGFVAELARSGRKVFLDLKLHDIPNTVAHAVQSVRGLGASMLTVHASGGAEMLKAAVEAAGPQLGVLAVTVLTSLSDQRLREIGVAGRTTDQVLLLAALAQTTGCRGVVASPQEVSQLRQALGNGLAIVSPGIRPSGADKNDQQRIATPREAIRAGASHLVVGRPISDANDPAQAVEAILAEMIE